MSLIKCVYCGYRNVHAATTCMNCRTPLPAALASSKQGRTSQTLSHGLDVLSSYGSTEDFPYGSEEDMHYPEQVKPRQVANRSVHHAYQRKLPAPRPEQEIAPFESYGDESPYQADMRTISLGPELVDLASEISTPDHTSFAIEPWKGDRLPFGFPLRSSNLAGTIINVDVKEELFDFPDLFTVIFRLLVEVIWILANIRENHETKRVTMTRLRVRTSDGTQQDAQMRGNMKGANLSLGDTVSLWGWRRKGILVVHRGYNYTSKAIISNHGTNTWFPVLFMLALMAAVIFCYPALFHGLSSFFTHLFP